MRGLRNRRSRSDARGPGDLGRSSLGGGQRMARPGAISCAHKGVLFLDDSTEAQIHPKRKPYRLAAIGGRAGITICRRSPPGTPSPHLVLVTRARDIAGGAASCVSLFGDGSSSAVEGAARLTASRNASPHEIAAERFVGSGASAKNTCETPVLTVPIRAPPALASPQSALIS
jgi:Magnesium chelatase, subunit ChlI